MYSSDYGGSVGELVVKVPTLTVVVKNLQIGRHPGGTRRVCRDCNLDTPRGPRGDRSPSKMSTGSDISPEAATMSGTASTTQEKISMRSREAGQKSW